MPVKPFSKAKCEAEMARFQCAGPNFKFARGTVTQIGSAAAVLLAAAPQQDGAHGAARPGPRRRIACDSEVARARARQGRPRPGARSSTPAAAAAGSGSRVGRAIAAMFHLNDSSESDELAAHPGPGRSRPRHGSQPCHGLRLGTRTARQCAVTNHHSTAVGMNGGRHISGAQFNLKFMSR